MLKTRLTIIRSDPAGNTTLFVQGDVPAEKYAELGGKLIKTERFEAEQAGFICAPRAGGAGRLVMSGEEFCGNASRAFGYYLALIHGLRKGTMQIEISGCDTLIPVDFDCDAGESYASMPLPKHLDHISFPEPFGILPVICFEGIWHVIACGFPYSMESFEMIKETVYKQFSPQALGVMFLSDDKKSMVPVVYVKGPETVFVESSCGSGTTAAAFWMAQQDTTLEEVCLKQPGGELIVKIIRYQGRIENIVMGGKVTFDSPEILEVEF